MSNQSHWKVKEVVLWFPSLSHEQKALGLFPSIFDIFSEETIVEVAVVNKKCWLEESGQWLETVD